MALDSSSVREVALLDKAEALEDLQRILNLDNNSYNENSTIELSVEHLYDVIKSTANFGSTWLEISHFVNLALNLQTTAKESNIAETVQQFRVEYESLQGCVNERNLKLFAEYFFSTFMKHFQLYKYTLSKLRDTKVIEYESLVDTPEEIAASKNSIPQNIWDYEQRYLAIEKMENDARMKRMEEKEKLALDGMDSEKLVEKEELYTASDDENEMKNLIERITSHHISNLNKSICLNIDASMEDLDYKFEKTNLARPQTLGPPPRFKPPTPTAQQKRSPGKEKPPSRTKSRESKKK